jgi:hypothetical protein
MKLLLAVSAAALVAQPAQLRRAIGDDDRHRDEASAASES